MPGIAFVLYLMSAVCFFTGGCSLILFIKRKTDRLSPFFSALCLAQALYFVAQAKWYGSTAIAQGLRSVQLAYGATALILMLQLWFFYYYSERAFPKLICTIGTVVNGFYFILSFFPGDFTFSADRVYVKEVVFFNLLQFRQYEFIPGMLFDLFLVLAFVEMMYLLVVLVRHSRNRYDSALKPLPLVFCLMCLAAVYDIIVAKGMLHSIYIGEFLYMLLILTMACEFITNFIDAMDEVESLNLHLDEKVAERTRELTTKTDELEKALGQVELLSGFLPICAHCKKIRDDKGYWNQLEAYISKHSEAEFSHSICPECARKLYPPLITARALVEHG